MDYCGPAGIPYSTFLAWPSFDQDAALSWKARQASRCPGCGTVEDEWDPDDRGRPQEHPWVASAHLCHGCMALDVARAAPAMRDAGAGISVRLVRPPDRP
jgi:hypothetical protein